jgi:hypothetical protein
MPAERSAGETTAGTVALNVPRRNHTATTLPDGRVLIVGGDNQYGPVSEVEMLDASSRAAYVVGSLAVPRTLHTATLLTDGRVLVTGGAGQAGLLDSTEIFDARTAAVSVGPRLKLARAGHTATVLPDGTVLVAGGRTDGAAELFDPASNRSTLIESKMTAARKAHSAILLGDGNVLLAGGEQNSEHNMESAEIFDSATMTFSPTAEPMLLPRARPALRLLPDGKLQVIGGDYDGSIEIYDPATRRFGAAAHLAPTADLFSKEEMLSAQTRAGFIDSISYRALKEERRLPEQLKKRITDFEDEKIGRSQYATAEIPDSGQAVVVGGLDDDRYLTRSAVVVRSSAAALSTDKVKYVPGEAPVIIGAGFAPLEKVTIVRQEARTSRKRRTFEAIANEQGVFISNALAARDYQVWTTYTLTARGTTSGQVAQTSYQDAPLPGQEWDTLPKHFAFRAPLSNKDLSVESETVLYKLTAHSDKAQGSVTSADTRGIRADAAVKNTDGGVNTADAGANLRDSFADVSAKAATVAPADVGPACGMPGTTPVTCTDVPQGGFGFNTSLPSDACFGIPGNPCSLGFGDAEFVNGSCISFSGMVNFNSCVNDNGKGFDCQDFPTTYLSFSVDQTFRAHVVLQEELDATKSLDLFNIPFGGGAKVPHVEISLEGHPEVFDLLLDTLLLGKLDVTTVCPFVFQERFDLQEGYTVGFNVSQKSAIDPPSIGFFANQTIDQTTMKPIAPVASGFAAVTKLGKGDVKFSVGPDLSVTLHVGTFPVDLGILGTIPSAALLDAGVDFGVLAFLDVGVANTSPTFNANTCTQSDNNCVQGDVTFKAGMDLAASGSLKVPLLDKVNGELTQNIFTTGQPLPIDPSVTVPAIPSVNFTCQNTGGTLTAHDFQVPTDQNQCSANLASYAQANAAATDSCGNTIDPSTFVFSPPLPHVFPKGTTHVTVTTTNAKGNPVAGSFNVTVVDNQAPVISTSGNITKSNDLNQCGAIVSYNVTATDNCDAVTPTCSPKPGSFFPRGTTTVNCTATDTSGNTGTTSFTVTVNETQPPVIASHGPVIAVIPPGQTCGVATFTPPLATDACGATVVCVPPSGSCFPAGVTKVTCTATNPGGIQASTSFPVIGTDTCLQDDRSGDFLQWSSVTGDYLFTHCANVATTPPFILQGKGTVGQVGTVRLLNDVKSDRNLNVKYLINQFTGHANLSIIIGPGLSVIYSLNQTNIHPTCACTNTSAAAIEPAFGAGSGSQPALGSQGRSAAKGRLRKSLVSSVQNAPAESGEVLPGVRTGRPVTTPKQLRGCLTISRSTFEVSRMQDNTHNLAFAILFESAPIGDNSPGFGEVKDYRLPEAPESS